MMVAKERVKNVFNYKLMKDGSILHKEKIVQSVFAKWKRIFDARCEIESENHTDDDAEDRVVSHFE
jgi:hypothetical protein